MMKFNMFNGTIVVPETEDMKETALSLVTSIVLRSHSVNDTKTFKKIGLGAGLVVLGVIVYKKLKKKK